MAVCETWMYECGECGQTDTGYDDEHAALKAELAHLKECSEDAEVIAAKETELWEFEAGVRSG